MGAPIAIKVSSTDTSNTNQDNRPLAVVLDEREQARARIAEANRLRDEAIAKDAAILAEYDKREREEWSLRLMALDVSRAEKTTARNKLNLELADIGTEMDQLKVKLGPVLTTSQGVPTVTEKPVVVDVIVEPKKNELLWRTKSRSKGGKVDAIKYGVFPETLNTSNPEYYDFDAKQRRSVTDLLKANGFTD